MKFIVLMVLGCSAPSEARVLLRARGFLNLVEPDRRKCLNYLEHSNTHRNKRIS